LPDKKEQVRSKRIWLEVVTPTKLELRKEVEYVVVPTKDGVVGILPGHIRLMSLLDTGVLRYKVGGNNYYMAVSEGFLEVTPHKVIVLAEAADLPENIDVKAALAEKREAEAVMHRPPGGKADLVKLEVSLQRAITKLDVAKKMGDVTE
jgi:F-type H+-transporting ATPase subunit epsilon